MEAIVDLGALDRARDGDLSAFDALMEARVGSMLRTAMAIMGDEWEARDAVQDALVSAWRQLGSLRDPGAFDAWVTRILVNRCRHGLRRRSRLRAREVRVEAANEVARGAGAGASTAAADVAGAVVDRTTLERAFDRLSIDERTLLVLHHVEGRPVASIASVLGIPVGTAKSRLSSARRSLERALQREAAR
jgi:RNA polymerase sigma-70 factor (ECF subfamily)